MSEDDWLAIFSTAAMRATLLRLQNEWEAVQASRDRGAIYQYLSAVFETVTAWAKEGRAINRAHRALHLRGHNSIRESEPFAAVIYCTVDRDMVDDRTRSKWSRALRYAAEYKDLDEPLLDFIKREGGINECAAPFASQLERGRPHGTSPFDAKRARKRFAPPIEAMSMTSGSYGRGQQTKIR